MIQFRCSGCNKAIGVDDQFGGRLIRCPACDIATRVPNVRDAVAPQAAEAPTQQYVAKAPVHPSCPSCQSELSNPSDAVCGVCGFLIDQVQAPTAAVSGHASPAAKPSKVIPGFAVEQYEKLPVNPAISPNQGGAKNMHRGYQPTASSSRPTKTRSTVAWFVAVLVGIFCASAWGIAASFFGAIGQMFAIAIGIVVGFLAGIIARSPTKRFSMATMFGAIGCLVFGRIVSAWVIMLTVNAAGFFGTILMPNNGLTVGVLERMIEDGSLEEDEVEYAQQKVDSFFANEIYEEDDENFEDFEEIVEGIEIDVDIKVRNAIRAMSPEERRELLGELRQKHPEWIEEDWHRLAVLDHLVRSDEISDDGLKEHAEAKLAEIDENFDSDYFQNHSYDETFDRESKLDILIAEKHASLDADERQKVFLEARKNHLAWTPVKHEYLAMLDRMHSKGEIPDELLSEAKSTIRLELEMDYDDTDFDFDSDSEIESDSTANIELRKLVNKSLLELSQDQIDELVKEAGDKHVLMSTPDDVSMIEFTSDLDEVITKFESDGTFWGSLKTRFRPLDVIWMVLGSICAFAIPKWFGSGRKEILS